MKRQIGKSIGVAKEEALQFAGELFKATVGECSWELCRANYDLDLRIVCGYRGEQHGLVLMRVEEIPGVKDTIEGCTVEVWTEADLELSLKAMRDWMRKVDGEKRAQAIATSGRPESDFAPNEEPL